MRILGRDEKAGIYLMQKKQMLFLDTSWVSDAFGRQKDPGNEERFVEILAALYEEYDIKITDRVYEEAVSDTAYPKDALLEEWLNDKGIEKIVTNTPPGRDAGEKSIIEVMGDHPQYAQAKIASHDVKFFDKDNRKKGGHAFARQVVTLQDTLGKLVLHDKLSPDVYRGVSTAGSPNLREGWQTVEQLKNALSDFMPQKNKTAEKTVPKSGKPHAGGMKFQP